MKRIVSVSLGSSQRNHKVTQRILGEEFIIERIGTDGNIDRAIELFKELDGKVDAFGLGGIDLHLHAGEKEYLLKDAKKIISNIQKTPIVDGSGLKNTLERMSIKQLNQRINLSEKKVLMVCALDRFGMAESLQESGVDMILGDLIFGLGLPIPIKSLETLYNIAKFIMPVVSRLPFKLLYPTGGKQEDISNKYSKYYEWADIIAGDFHYIRKYLPLSLTDKQIITNTVTEDDIKLLANRGLNKLITTTPEFRGRSFGTNVIEAVLVSILDKPLAKIKVSDYVNLLREVDFQPRIEDLNKLYNLN